MNLTPGQRQQIIETVARRVIERIGGAELESTPVSASREGILPCAIPPPGSPRYEAVMRALDQPRAPKSPADTGLAGMIDHTLLRPDATEAEIEKLCGEAVEHRFATVCVNGCYVSLCKKRVAGSEVKVCAVVGFPLGAATSEAKTFEAREAVQLGADEIDMVLNIGRLKGGDHRAVRDEIAAVVAAAQGRTVKVILEAALLTDEEKIAGCAIAKVAGAHFVKTSTGFGPGGATERDVALLRASVGPSMGVKAAGGIRDAATARRMIAAGAIRIGCSASVKIVSEA